MLASWRLRISDSVFDITHAARVNKRAVDEFATLETGDEDYTDTSKDITVAAKDLGEDKNEAAETSAYRVYHV